MFKMKSDILIKSIDIYTLKIPLKKPIKMAGIIVDSAENLFVKITNQNDNYGWGEASSAPTMTGEFSQGMFAAAIFLKNILINKNITSLNDLDILKNSPLYENKGAKSAFEIALLDLIAKENEVPLYKIFSDSKRPSIPIIKMVAGKNLAEEIANQLSSINFDGIVNISGTGEATLTKHLSDIVQKFGDKKIHIELVTNGDKLKPKLIESLYNAGLQQMVVSMYDGPEQIQYFKDLFKESNVGDNYYTLRDRWYDEEEDYGLLYTNRAGSMGDKLLSPHERPCYYTHYSTYIDWNGDVLLCCQDMYNRTKIFGNVLEKKLVDIWIDKKLIDYRKKLSVGKRVLSPCDNCTANGMVFGDKHSKLW